MSFPKEFSSTLINILISGSFCDNLTRNKLFSNFSLSVFKVTGLELPFLKLRCSFLFKCFLILCKGMNISNLDFMYFCTSIESNHSVCFLTKSDIHSVTICESIFFLHLIFENTSCLLMFELNCFFDPSRS